MPRQACQRCTLRIGGDSSSAASFVISAASLVIPAEAGAAPPVSCSSASLAISTGASVAYGAASCAEFVATPLSEKAARRLPN